MGEGGSEGGGGMWIGGGRDVQVDDLAFFVFHGCGGGVRWFGMGFGGVWLLVRVVSFENGVGVCAAWISLVGGSLPRPWSAALDDWAWL